jgi:radical SAM protein with 4Fe4S-binding SPASM domain
MDIKELARQTNKVNKHLKKLGKFSLFLPPTFSPENLKAYLEAKWDNMTDQYRTCPAPWVGLDITASGDLAPCHIFYDLVMGNLYEHSFEEIWNGEKYQIFRAYMKEHKLMSICPGCCILYLAGRRIKKRKKIIA